MATSWLLTSHALTLSLLHLLYCGLLSLVYIYSYIQKSKSLYFRTFPVETETKGCETNSLTEPLPPFSSFIIHNNVYTIRRTLYENCSCTQMYSRGRKKKKRKASYTSNNEYEMHSSHSSCRYTLCMHTTYANGHTGYIEKDFTVCSLEVKRERRFAENYTTCWLSNACKFSHICTRVSLDEASARFDRDRFAIGAGIKTVDTAGN